MADLVSPEYLSAVNVTVGYIWSAYDIEIAGTKKSPDDQIDAARLAVGEIAGEVKVLHDPQEILGAMAVFAGAMSVLREDPEWDVKYDLAKVARRATDPKNVKPLTEPAYLALFSARREFGIDETWHARIARAFGRFQSQP